MSDETRHDTEGIGFGVEGLKISTYRERARESERERERARERERERESARARSREQFLFRKHTHTNFALLTLLCLRHLRSTFFSPPLTET